MWDDTSANFNLLMFDLGSAMPGNLTDIGMDFDEPSDSEAAINTNASKNNSNLLEFDRFREIQLYTLFKYIIRATRKIPSNFHLENFRAILLTR